METKDSSQQSLDARLNEIEARVAGMPADARNNLQPRLDALRTRLAEVRRQSRDDHEYDDRDSDVASRDLGHEIDDLYDELRTGPS